MKQIEFGLMFLMLFSSTAATSAVHLSENEAVVFYSQDILGSPVAVSDEQGRVLWYENTQPFGKSLNRKTPQGEGFGDAFTEQSASRIGYTGHQRDNETELVYMKARYYDPHIGRFYSNDPIGFFEQNPKSFNRYQYALNNPYYYTDPLGLHGADYTAQNTAGKNETPTDEASYVKTERDRAIERGDESAYDHYANAYRNDQDDNKDGFLDALANWKNDAREMFFNASSLVVQRGPWNKGYTCTDSGLACHDVPVVSGNSDFLVHGTVTIEQMPNGEWGIRSERYNFEQRPEGTGLRNSLTSIGAEIHGDGTAVGMHFIGSPKIYDGLY